MPAERTAPPAVFAALGDPTRLHLLERLSDGTPRSIAALTEGLEITRQATSKHLKVLEGAGLVRSDRTGRESRFALDSRALAEARAYLDLVSAHWDRALGRLRRLVEEE